MDKLKLFFRSEIFFFLLLIPSALFAFYFVCFQVEQKYNRAAANLRRLQIYTDYSHFTPPVVPDEENASNLIMEAVYKIWDLERNTPPAQANRYQTIVGIYLETGIMGLVSASNIERLYQLSRPYQPAMEIFDKALALDRAYYDLDYSDSLNSEYEDYGNRRRLAYLQRIRAMYALKHEKREEGVRAVLDLFHFADLIAQEHPLFMCASSSLEQSFVACGALHQLQWTTPLSAEERSRFRENIDRVLQAERIVESFEAEAANWFSVERQTLEKITLPEHRRLAPFYRLYLEANLAEGMEYYANLIPFLRSYSCEQIASLNQVSINRSVPAWAQLVEHGMTDFPSLIRFRERGRVFLNMAVLSLVLLDYKETHGAYPDNLSALGGSAPRKYTRDPFSCRDLSYIKNPTGAVLYSVGPDAKDERGVMRKDLETDHYLGDYAWTLP